MHKPLSLLLLLSSPLHAELITEPVKVTSQRDNLLGLAESASEGSVSQARISQLPLSRPGEVLELTPGMVVSQHSGDGKANQYYLRGFNLDHGTDFSTWLEGMPLNMPTHAHGQGYTDTNLLIPELISGLHYRKGPYYAEAGDFSAAGTASLAYARTLPKGIAQISLGPNQYQRLLNADSVTLAGGNLLYALELQRDHGPWDSPQDLRKLNGVLRYSQGTQAQGFDILAMTYQNHWDASDQVPQRAVESGQIGRFGSIDTSSGGETQRTSLSADWRQGPWQASAYAVSSHLNLFSNFTYFLDDPLNGDQFEQADRRRIYGGKLKYSWDQVVLGIPGLHDLGLQTRVDDIRNVGLYHTRDRTRLDTVRQDKVKQASAGLWWQSSWALAPNWRVITGLRADQYAFDVNSDLAVNSGTEQAHLLSPKLGLAWRAGPDTELYTNWGRGFHSNDGRGSTIRIDPGTGDPATRVDPLVRAVGQEVGLRAHWLPGWQSTLALFQLELDSELLFIGDAGATEASRPSRRVGMEWSNALQVGRWGQLEADVALTRARFRDASADGHHIPGAVESTASLGYRLQRGPWSGAVRLRYLGPRALIEDNSVRSESALLVNSRVGYQINPQLGIAVDVINLFDRKVSDIDYFYLSRLPGEATSGVADLHSHPAQPRMLRVSVRLSY